MKMRGLIIFLLNISIILATPQFRAVDCDFSDSDDERVHTTTPNAHPATSQFRAVDCNFSDSDDECVQVAPIDVHSDIRRVHCLVSHHKTEQMVDIESVVKSTAMLFIGVDYLLIACYAADDYGNPELTEVSTFKKITHSKKGFRKRQIDRSLAKWKKVLRVNPDENSRIVSIHKLPSPKLLLQLANILTQDGEIFSVIANFDQAVDVGFAIDATMRNARENCARDIADISTAYYSPVGRSPCTDDPSKDLPSKTRLGRTLSDLFKDRKKTGSPTLLRDAMERGMLQSYSQCLVRNIIPFIVCTGNNILHDEHLVKSIQATMDSAHSDVQILQEPIDKAIMRQKLIIIFKMMLGNSRIIEEVAGLREQQAPPQSDDTSTNVLLRVSEPFVMSRIATGIWKKKHLLGQSTDVEEEEEEDEE